MTRNLVRLARLRRRVHASWKATLVVAVLGWMIFGWAGLVSGLGGFLVVFAVVLMRPVFEVWLSNQCFCGKCGADVFMEVCRAEAAGGVEEGVRCPACGADAVWDV